jgi:REP element-mobilizing transposase RayT
VFRTEGAKKSLLKSLAEVADKLDWQIHAWVIMTNHFHVALETPSGNLVNGMKEWQGTFATRFNRLRKEQGHIFQGRYKSLLVEPGRLGSLCHYIHLNPVRARICGASELSDWAWSSLHWIFNPKWRPKWFNPDTALRAAGGLPDTPRGHRLYRDYLKLLSTDAKDKRDQLFEKMSKGWIVGSPEFKKDMLKTKDALPRRTAGRSADLQDGNELWWEETLANLLNQAGFAAGDIDQSAKSAAWKTALAVRMKELTIVTNRWLGNRLNMGGLHEVSRWINAWKRNPDRAVERELGFTTNYKA